MASPIPEQQPQGQRKKTCGAKTRSGGKCQQTRLAQNGRCRMHGGATPSGLASPHFKHGRWSKYMPQDIAGRYGEALEDQTLMTIRMDVALVDALLTGLTEKLKEGKAVTAPQRKEILALVDQRRRLIESEARRMTALAQTITLAQFMAMVRVVAELFRQHVTDPAALTDIQKQLQRLLLAKGETDGDDGEADA